MKYNKIKKNSLQHKQQVPVKKNSKTNNAQLHVRTDHMYMYVYCV